VLNPFLILFNQVKSALDKESSLSPSERKLFQWQFLLTVAGISYLVGKGGSNTMFYKIGDTDLSYDYPENMLNLIKSWSKRKFVSYSWFKGSKRGKTIYYSEKEAKSKVPKSFYSDFYIVGETKEGKKIKLFKLHQTLSDLKWIDHDS
jgi:hypothetical protein